MATFPHRPPAADHDDHAEVEAVRTDLACPACEYNLRGLYGTIVHCPECGTACDVARLVTRRWTRPWYRAPKFNTVLMPVTVVYVGLPAIFMVGGCLRAGPRMTMVLLLTGMAAWGWQMARAWRVFGGPRGLWLALLAHVLLVGYIVGVFGLLVSVGSFFGGVTYKQQVLSVTLAAAGHGVLTIGLLVLVWGCRRGERFIAEQCIRRYLMRVPKE